MKMNTEMNNWKNDDEFICKDVAPTVSFIESFRENGDVFFNLRTLEELEYTILYSPAGFQ
eukprot:Awhi_evm1s11335